MISLETLPAHRIITTSQVSTEMVCMITGVLPEEMIGQLVLDMGSGYRQQFARDIDAIGGTVVSLDPNLPHTDEYVLRKKENDIRGDSIDAERNYGYDMGQLAITQSYADLKQELRKRGYRGPIDDTPECKEVIAQITREELGWPDQAYGRVVAGVAQMLPFPDRTFDRAIATTSVPFGLTREEIPAMLGEASRVLKRRGTAHFWPIVADTDIYEPITLPEIRDLIKQARKELSAAAKDAETLQERQRLQSEKVALEGFGLEVRTQAEVRLAYTVLADMLPPNMAAQSQSLMLTRKIA